MFARAGLPMQAALQVFYAGMAVYGWWSWRGGAGAKVTPLAVTCWPPRRHLALLAGVVAVAVVNGRWLAIAQPGAAAPYLDAFITWGSVAATWLVARKVLENWLWWIVLDLGAAALYWSQGLAATAVLFLLYTVIAAQGYRRWRQDLKQPLRATGGATSD